MIFFLVISTLLTLGSLCEASNADDTQALHKFIESTQGMKLWPPAWRNGDGWAHRKACDGRLMGITCNKDRVAALDHRSGTAGGTLPAEITLLTAAHTVDVSYNIISGTLPDPKRWVDSSKLLAFVVCHNKLSGTVPEGYGYIKSLRFLMLNNNEFTGTIPESLFKGLTKIEGLFLDGNKFSGTLPSTSVVMPTLLHLRVQNNVDLYGSFATWETPNLLWLETENTKVIPQGLKAPQANCRKGTDERLCPHQWTPMRFMMMGDFGTGGYMTCSPRELSSAKQFNEYAEMVDSNFTLSVGDNFYTDSVIEVFFQESFESLYTVPALNRPWYAAFGNHDIKSQLFYRSPRWKQPGTYFSIRNISIPGTPYTFDVVVVDSASKRGPPRDMWGWLKREMESIVKSTTSRYTILVTHYPLISSGCHRKHRNAYAVWKEVSKYNVTTLYIAGHDHHLEIGQKSGTFHAVTGAHSRGPCTHSGSTDTYWRERFVGGFSFVTMDPNVMNVTFVNQYGVVAHVTSIPFDWRTNWQTYSLFNLPSTTTQEDPSKPTTSVELPQITATQFAENEIKYSRLNIGGSRSTTASSTTKKPPKVSESSSVPPPSPPPVVIPAGVPTSMFDITLALCGTNRSLSTYQTNLMQGSKIFPTAFPTCEGVSGGPNKSNTGNATATKYPSIADGAPYVASVDSLGTSTFVIVNRAMVFLCVMKAPSTSFVLHSALVPTCSSGTRDTMIRSVSGSMLFTVSAGLSLSVLAIGVFYRISQTRKNSNQVPT